MSENNINLQTVLITLPYVDWNTTSPSTVDAVAALESGKVLYFPHLAFSLTDAEKTLLSPELVDPKRKNISYQPEQQKLTGVALEAKREAVHKLLARHYQACQHLINSVLPEYRHAVQMPTNSLRLHPISAWTAATSWRKDDSLLHVDAFPSRPNYGKRILRIFTNINPHGESRLWRVGEPFPELAQRFLPRLKRYSPFASWLQDKVGITKTRRSHYDHLMLQMHDAMKADKNYQESGPQQAVEFPPGSSWICFSDQTPHAAMAGQYMLEQTFILPVSAMKTPQNAPLKVLEGLLHRPLI
ncbi:Kdo hydroxylase family protein [Serratia sp. (in: enterobacteria)]|uniref:Kdo hydroxylase family protein n=1 Tax=Serratia sp. (in: enterobacteria) TaxID=616 RepID=UPI003988CC46